jgi:multidrug efflux pump subunit AcrA (membrane-fusion protein)
MFGRISIVYDRHENVLQVPRSAIIEELAGESVFVVEDDMAVRRTVTTGYGESGMIEIVEGLEETDNVIIVGQVGLKPGAKVTVINAAADGDN